jgi:hypothetical protein
LIQRSQQAQGEIVQADANHRSFLDFNPGVSLVQIKSVRNFKSFDIQDIHRLNHGVNGKLITEILIEFAIGTLVVMGAAAELNVADHMMQAWLLPGRQLTQFVLPENNPAALARRNPALFFELQVFGGDTPHGAIIGTGRALVFKPAKLFGNHARLHPNAWGVVLGLFIFYSRGNHCISPCQEQQVVGQWLLVIRDGTFDFPIITNNK